jgi:hypothetical protein
MNPITMIELNKSQDNQCAGKGCNKQGNHYLKVLFLNKIGCFCDSCKISLLEDNLVEKPE